ncbi:MAG: imelysin family protein [Alphaproteobacteria bacterium]
MRRYLLTMMILLLPGMAAAAPMPDSSYRELNAVLTDRYLLPRYGALATAADSFAEATQAVCQAPGETTLQAARSGFHAIMDAWMAVQHVRFGPVELFMRGYRVYFWPESRGRVDDSVRQVLAEHPDGDFASKPLARTSVAVQGLPAAEQLLFVGPDRLGMPGEGQARCGLLLAVGANLVEIAHGLMTDWTGAQEPFRNVVAKPGPENIYFETPRDVTLAYFKALHNGLQLIADLRLKPVLGASIQQAQPRLAESSASRRSLRNIVTSLETLQAMYVEGGISAAVRAQPGRQDLDALLVRAFAMTLESAKAVPEPLGKAVSDPETRGAVELLYKRVLALKQIIRTDLADALDVAVGFNALDGD